MENKKDKQIALPKNIRQIGSFGEKYKIYVEDFVYTYVHQILHEKKEENKVLAAVLLGKTLKEEDKEYIFISGAQRCDFHISPENGEDAQGRQQEFWGGIYQRIKEYFTNKEILGWYINLDGSNLELNKQLQQFFEATYSRGSRFLYYEDSLEHLDAFFVQEQHTLQQVSGYAVYYEKNPQMQEFMVSEKERLQPKNPSGVVTFDKREDVAQNYRAIMNKLNEKPPKKKAQPLIYVAGVAVLAIVTATGVTQIGNYQNLKTLENTLQTLSGSVSPEDADGKDASSQPEQKSAAQTSAVSDTKNSQQGNTADKQGQAGSKTDEQKNQEAESTADGAKTAAETKTEPKDSSQTKESAKESASAENTDKKTAGEKETKKTSAGTQKKTYYTVKKGDSLVSISKALYNTTSKIKEICSLNNIENMDMIYEGQKLLLP